MERKGNCEICQSFENLLIDNLSDFFLIEYTAQQGACAAERRNARQLIDYLMVGRYVIGIFMAYVLQIISISITNNK